MAISRFAAFYGMANGPSQGLDRMAAHFGRAVAPKAFCQSIWPEYRSIPIVPISQVRAGLARQLDRGL